MDCSICTTMPFILRPPRNTICTACYEGARSLITLTNDKGGAEKPINTAISSPNCKVTRSYGWPLLLGSKQPTQFPDQLTKYPGFANALRWIKEMKDLEDELYEKLTFLGGFASSFRDQIHTDIQIKPGNNGPPISAHRALLAARSEIFKNMLDSDGCKAAPSDTITLPELEYEELECLLEFLYTGTLPNGKIEKHIYSLSIAADKYNIPYLQRFCEQRMLGSLNASNALDILEISDLCSNKSLKETSLNFIVKNMEDVVFSARFDAFALKNPHLTVQITRASFIDIRNRRTAA